MDLKIENTSIYSLTPAYGPQPVVLNTEFPPYFWEVNFSINLWDNKGIINGDGKYHIHIKNEDGDDSKKRIFIWS